MSGTLHFTTRSGRTYRRAVPVYVVYMFWALIFAGIPLLLGWLTVAWWTEGILPVLIAGFIWHGFLWAVGFFKWNA